MRFAKLWAISIAVCIVGTLASCSNRVAREIPAFEFDIWGSAPIDLTKDRLAQNILFTIKERALTSEKIASLTNAPEGAVKAKLEGLNQVDVVKKEENKWIANIPLYVKKEMDEGEKVGLKYAEQEADILRDEIPHLKEVYAQTRISKYFPWDKISFIVVGAFLSDFCVVDRIPFKPENFTPEMQPPLGKEGQAKWGYEGYEVLPKRFPSRKWKFYQNDASVFSGGGARFGYYRNPDEQRKRPPARPESLFIGATGKILSALADGPLNHKELLRRSRLGEETLGKTLEWLGALNPPAIVLQGGQYTLNILVFPKSDFELLLPELDRVAEIIFKRVVLNHMKERKEKAKELGYRWPLPADTYVRDKALQILVEEGLLTPVQDPPVDWNFSVWGWRGFLAMHAQVANNIQPPEPDHFIDTPISNEEKKAIGEFRSIKKNILKGEKFLDFSTPVRAFLTRISGFYNGDLDALKGVWVRWEQLKGQFSQEDIKQQAKHMSQLEISRVHLPSTKPKDGDLVPIFTTGGEGDTYVFFYYRGEWKSLGNTYESEEYWRASMDESLKQELAYLQNKDKGF